VLPRGLFSKMTKKFLSAFLVCSFLLAGCSSEPKAIEQFYDQLYLDVESQLDDGYSLDQLKALDTVEKRNEFYTVGYEKANSVIANLKSKAGIALTESSEKEREILVELIKMYESYSRETRQAIKLLSNYYNDCPDATRRPAGTLPSHACGDIALTVEDLKTSSLVCVYYLSATFLGDFSGFDKSKVNFLNSGMSEDVISQGCEAFPQSASLLGYPHRTSRWVVPEKMQREINSDFIIAVADGLYTNIVPGVPILEQAVYGSWFGDCSAFNIMEARLPKQVKSGNCW
jgi:hypothetical protein